jgi:hypothetical protein
VCLFGSKVINKPEGLLDPEFTKRGRIEHHFYAMGAVSIVFVEAEKRYATGRKKLDVIAQVLAESLGMSHFPNVFLPFVVASDLITLLIISASDYVNSKIQHWVPVLAIICDGENFEFLVLDSGIKSVYSTGVVTGVIDRRRRPGLLMPTLKESKVANHLLLFKIDSFP